MKRVFAGGQGQTTAALGPHSLIAQPIGPLAEQVCSAWHLGGELRLGLAELKFRHMGRPLLWRIPVEYRTDFAREIIAEMPLRAFPVDRLASGRQNDITRARVLDGELSFQDKIEPVLVEIGFPGLR